MLEQTGIRLTSQERDQIEIAELGLGELERTGLDLVMFPRQTCPKHRHPTVGGQPGKITGEGSISVN